MGIASMVIGIISIMVAFIPFCGIFTLIPAGIALILGIVDVAIKSKKECGKGCGIAGIVLNAAAIVITILWYSLATTATVSIAQEMDKAIQEAARNGSAVEISIEQSVEPQSEVVPPGF